MTRKITFLHILKLFGYAYAIGLIAILCAPSLYSIMYESDDFKNLEYPQSAIRDVFYYMLISVPYILLIRIILIAADPDWYIKLRSHLRHIRH